MITKVKLVNWRSHLSSEFVFSPGTNVLVGIMGSGKTSLMDAICFALFGNFPLLQSRKLKLDDVIMRKPYQQQSAEVCVWFEFNGKKYSVLRKIERGKRTSYAELRENGKILEAPSPARVTERIEEILQVNYDVFTKAVYSEQNALDYFLTIPRGQRMKKIDELLMLEKFEKVRANSVSLANKISERVESKSSLLDRLGVEELQSSLAELKNSSQALQKEREKLASELERKKIERDKLEKELAELKKLQADKERCEKVEKGLSSALQEVERSLQELGELKVQDAEFLKAKLQELELKLKELQNLLELRRGEEERRSQRLAELRLLLETLKEEKIKRCEKELEQLESKKKLLAEIHQKLGKEPEEVVVERRALHQKVLEEEKTLRLKLSDSETLLQLLSSEKPHCPVCKRELTQDLKEKLLKNLEEEVKRLQAELEEILREKELSDQKLKEAEELWKSSAQLLLEIKDMEKYEEELREARKKFVEVSEEATKLRQEAEEFKQELKKLEQGLEKVSQEKQSLEIQLSKVLEFQRLFKRMEELAKQREEALKLLQQLENSLQGKDLTLLEEKYKQLFAEEKEMETLLKAKLQLLEDKEERIKELEQRIEQLQRERKEVRELENLFKQVKIFSKAVEQTQVDFRKDVISTINYTMNNLWQSLYPYQDFVGIKLEIEGGDYVLKLQERSGRWVSVEGIASGGERSLAALTLRIAFSLVLAPQLRWLVLDEPTANLDVKAIQDLADTLRLRIGDFIDQVFLITHEEMLESAATGNVYRLERDKTKDEATRVIAL